MVVTERRGPGETAAVAKKVIMADVVVGGNDGGVAIFVCADVGPTDGFVES